MSAPLAELDDQGAAPGDRASATPGGAITTHGGAGAVGAAPVRGPAADVLRWFQAVVTHPDSVEAGRLAAQPLEDALGAQQLEDLITSSTQLGARDRLAIYHHGYRARLVECVTDDYRVLARALGAAPFEALARLYVAQHPSRSWDLVPYAAELPALLASLAAGAAPAWWTSPLPLAAAHDLARLEWAMVEVMHAPAPAAMPLTALAAVPPERWGDVRLTPSRALRVLTLEHDVHALCKAVVAGTPWPNTTPRPAWVAVWRQGRDIWRMALTRVTAAVLGALIAGETLGEALSRVEAEAPDTSAGVEDDVLRWFGEWVASGFFAGFEVVEA